MMSARRARSRHVGRIAAAAIAIGVGAVGLASVPSSAATTSVSGAVVRDLNHNGVTDPGEPGWAGVTVTATAPDGTSSVATSDDDGYYTINELDDAQTYRVAFSWAEDWLAAGPVGPNNGSSVQFVRGGATANFALVTAADYCDVGDAELDFTTTCFINGDPLDPASAFAERDALVSIHGASAGIAGKNGADPDYPTLVATNSVIGSTYGLAWQPSNERLFTSAFLKRHIGLGTGGIDAIYQVDDDGASLWYSGIDAGTIGTNVERGLPTAIDDPSSLDATAFAAVYKVGWGDIDLSADERTLYAANLFDRSIYAIDVAGVDAGTPDAHIAIGRPNHTCAGGVDRIFAIEVHDGTVWTGVTCTAETSNDASDLSAAIYGYDLAAQSWAPTPALEFPLDYTKGCGQHSRSCGFEPWIDVYSDDAFSLAVNDSAFEGPQRPQPVIADLEIDRDGSLIIGIRDRTGDQFGHRNLSPAGDGNLLTGFSSGDILRASSDGVGLWILESNGSVGGVTSAGAGTDNTGPGGVGSGQGPGGGEFYSDDYVLNGSTEFHSETALGALALAPGRPDVAATNFDPINNRLDAAGVSWFSNTSGLTTHEYELYRDAGIPQPATLGKASGLGDLEALCPPAPVEVGDRVWFDRDRDGIQDPDEPGIPGVKVLINGETIVTGADGTWVLPVDPNTAYQVGFDPSMADVTGLPDVESADALLPTVANAGESDLIDSDMDVETLQIDLVSGAPGANDHSFDAGFSILATDAEPEPVPESSLELGNLVWLDLNNDGIAEMGETGIPGVIVELWIDSDSDGAKDTLVDSTATDASGHYAFSELNKGIYFVSIPGQHGDGEPLAGLTSSTPSVGAADDDADNDDNGLGPFTPNGTVLSGPVSLMPGTEPETEVNRSTKTERDLSPAGLEDNDSNLSVDFGFYPTAKLGDIVWLDENRNGVQDIDEAPVAEVAVHLCDANMNPLATAVTGSNGMYMFGGLAPGDYMVCFDLDSLPVGYEVTDQTVGENGGLDSDADPATGKTGAVTLGPGDVFLDLDLGIAPVVEVETPIVAAPDVTVVPTTVPAPTTTIVETTTSESAPAGTAPATDGANDQAIAEQQPTETTVGPPVAADQIAFTGGSTTTLAAIASLLLGVGMGLLALKKLRFT